jgi:hypothetical protein
MKIMNSGLIGIKKRLIVIKMLMLLILFICITGCNTKKPPYFTQPDESLVKELNNKKVIILGDFRHYNAWPYSTLTKFLWEWLKQVERGDSKAWNITLVLETDEEVIDRLNKYITTGDIKKAYDYLSPFNNLETVEYWSELRKLSLSVDSLNALAKYSPKIVFKIAGGEASNVFANMDFYKKSEYEQNLYGVNMRDSLIAQKIIKLSEEDADKKIIVLYGNAHLDKTLTDKSPYLKSVPKDKAQGYFFAHYLKDYFGENNLLTVRQSPVVDGRKLKDTPFENLTGEEFFVKAADYPEMMSRVDWLVMRRDQFVPEYSMGYIFSINTIKACLEKMKMLEGYKSLPVIKDYYSEITNYLYFLTGCNFAAYPELKKWIAENESKYNGFEWLSSKEFEMLIRKEYFDRSKDISIISSQLLSMGFKSGNKRISETEWDNVWKGSLGDIKFVNSIGMAICGTEAEKVNALKYLEEYSKIKLSNPIEYLKYYRKKAYNVNY